MTWRLAPDCKIVHPYGEDSWRPAANGQHEHLIEWQESPREKIDRWLILAAGSLPGWANTVRAALAAYDEDHREGSWIRGSIRQDGCRCQNSWPCSTKARHEAELARAIGL